jgi:hypothetical protein
MSSLRTPKRKLTSTPGGDGGARSGNRSRRSSVASTGRSGGRRASSGRRASGGRRSSGDGGGGADAGASGTGGASGAAAGAGGDAAAPSDGRDGSASGGGGALLAESGGRSKRTRRDSDKWNVKADDPDAAKHEQAADVATTQPPLTKSALKRKYSQSVLAAIDLAEEAAELQRLPADQWDKIVECLEHIRAVASVHPQRLAGKEELVFAALSHCVPNARSAIPRHALNTLQVVLAGVAALGPDGSAFAAQTHLAGPTRALVLLLLKTSATHDKNFIKAAATRCVAEATAAARGSQTFAEHFTAAEALQHKSRLAVAAAVAGFQKCVETCPPETLASAWDAELLAASLQRVFTAGTSNARSAATAVARVLTGSGGGGLDAAALENVRGRFASGKGVTPADAATLFKPQRHSGRKPSRPWAAVGGGRGGRGGGGGGGGAASSGGGGGGGADADVASGR